MPKQIWDKILSPGEEIKFEFGLGKKYMNYIKSVWIGAGILILFFGLILSGKPSTILRIFSLILILFGIIFIIIGFVWGWYLKRANNFAFTNKRILILRGWLSTQLTSIDYEKITDIKAEQEFFEKIAFNTGTLTIDTAGTNFPEVILTDIENPYEIKKKLDEIRDNLREKYEKVI